MGIYNIRRALFFTRREMRGVLWLLPLLAAVVVVVAVANKPRFEQSFLQQVEEAVDGGQWTVDNGKWRGGNVSQGREGVASPKSYAHYAPRAVRKSLVALKPFDPNALNASGFEALGFSSRQATVIVNYRTARGGFRSADDLAKCRVISPEMMARLRPFVVVESGELKVESGGSGVNGGDANDGDAKKLVELNTADSTALRTVSGIGNVLVVGVLDYRVRLGGFVGKGQLREIPGMTPENFERIAPQISVDSAVIKKIDANFAPAEVLGKHPYIDAVTLRKWLKNRQLKGGWRSTQELIDENILTEDRAARLGPYLIFNETFNEKNTQQ